MTLKQFRVNIKAVTWVGLGLSQAMVKIFMTK
jgi:hypothetical protein